MRPKVVPPGEGETLTVVGDVLTFKLTAADTAERFVLAEETLAPGEPCTDASAPPPPLPDPARLMPLLDKHGMDV
jgi:hypothetical protein